MIGNFEEQFKQTFEVNRAAKKPVIELHPELAKCVEECGTIPALRHPLYTVAPFFGHQVEVENANRCYEWALKRSNEYLADGDAEGYIFTHARPFRVDALAKAILDLGLKDEAYWRCVRRVWVDSENPSINLNLWRLMFFTFRENQHMMMDSDEIKALRELPDTLTVYRGGSRSGLSWTLSEDKANWFAGRFRGRHSVYEATVSKSDVLGLFLSRGEDEILVDVDKLKDIKKTK